MLSRIELSKDNKIAIAKDAIEQRDFPTALGISRQLLVYNEADALFIQAYCLSGMARAEDAQTAHKMAYEAVKADCSGRGLLDIANSAAELELSFDYRAELYEEAGELLKRENANRVDIADAYNKAGLSHYHAGSELELEKADFEKALSVMETKVCRSDKTKRILALIRCNYAECFARGGDNQRALELYTKAVGYFGKKLALADGFCFDPYCGCMRGISDIYRNNEDLPNALLTLNKMIATLEKYRRTFAGAVPEQVLQQLAYAYNARGTVRFHMHNFAGEIEDCGVSLELRGKLPTDNCGNAAVLCNRAEAFAALGKNDEAVADFKEAIELYAAETSYEARSSYAERAFWLAQLLEEMKRNADAATYYEYAAKEFSSLRKDESYAGYYTTEQLADVEALCRFKLATCFSSSERLDYYDSITQLHIALELLEQLPMTPEREVKLSTLHNSLGELYELFGELEASEREYLLAVELSASSYEEDDGSDEPSDDCISDDKPRAEIEKEQGDEQWADDDDTPEA